MASRTARCVPLGAALGIVCCLAACNGDAVTLPAPNNVIESLVGPRNLNAPVQTVPPAQPPPPAPNAQPIAPVLVGGAVQEQSANQRTFYGARLIQTSYLQAQQPDMPALPPALVAANAELLRVALAQEVPHPVTLSPARQQALIALARTMAEAGHLFIRRPQLVLIVDRARAGQTLSVTLARPDGPWEILGSRVVSTGKPGRKEHFVTPVGVLLNDGSELGYRAQGTYNQNHIRGLGVKGMRVWDFGWQTSDDWRTPGATMQVRVEMHATDPAVLAQRLGRADSEGCIRIPEALNRFLDRRGIIDADIEKLAETDAGYRALLSPYLTPTPLAGDAVIVVDSSAPWARPYPPAVTLSYSG